MKIDFTNMVIEYEDYTGTPKFEDFVSMVWDKIVITHDVWRWKYFSNRHGEIWTKNGKYIGSPPPIVPKPKNFDPHSVKSFFEVYDQLMEKKAMMEGKENRRFKMEISAKRRQGENVSQAIREYIEHVTGEEYDKHKHQVRFDSLRKLAK